MPRPGGLGKPRWWVCTNPDCGRFDGDPVSSQFDNEKCPECRQPLTYISDIGDWGG